MPPANWINRYHLPRVIASQIAERNPARGLVAATQTGVAQLHAWDVNSGDLRPLTDIPGGIVSGGISADGRYAYYLDGDSGHYQRVPYEGGAPQDLTPDLPPYDSYSISESLNGKWLGFVAVTTDYAMYLLRQGVSGQVGLPELLYRSDSLSYGPLLTYEADYAVIATTERSQRGDYRMMAFNLTTTVPDQKVRILAEQGGSVRPLAFAPLPGDTRLLALTDVTGVDRPLIWDVASGDRVDFPLDEIDGDLGAYGWSADGERLLLYRLHEARFTLYVYDLARSTFERLDTPGGTIRGASFTPGGEITLDWEDSTHPPQVIALDPTSGQTRDVLALHGPTGRPWREVRFPAPGGNTIQGWLATPAGEGPFPAVIHAHGGPTDVVTEHFDAEAQAWVDSGVAWLAVNYRGSTSFGADFAASIVGIPGHREVDDLAAGAAYLLEQGIAREGCVFVTGADYGGYLVLQALGRRPDLWAGGVATNAIADWRLLYDDLPEALRTYQRSLFGGTPEDTPDLHRASSPLTYAEQVSAPLLVFQTEDDPRFPPRQMQTYVERLRALGAEIEVHWTRRRSTDDPVAAAVDRQGDALRFALQNCKP